MTGKLEGIIYDSGMVARPGYYSGRGATTTDLDSNKLINIHDSIKHTFGDNEAKAFYFMVNSMPKLSATDFLISLSSLEASGWEVKQATTSNRDSIYPEDMGTALGTFASVMSGMNNRDDTYMIKSQFIITFAKEYRHAPTHERTNCFGRIL